MQGIPRERPKMIATCTHDVVALLREWQAEGGRPLHLDPRSRWVAPEGVTFPSQMQCPFRDCEVAVNTHTEMVSHVEVVGQPKTHQGNAKNWICSGKKLCKWSNSLNATIV